MIKYNPSRNPLKIQMANLRKSSVCYAGSNTGWIKNPKRDESSTIKSFFIWWKPHNTWYSNVNRDLEFQYNNLITCDGSSTDSPMEIDINVRKLNTLTTYITHSTIVRGYVSVSPKLDTLNSRANLNCNLASLKQ